MRTQSPTGKVLCGRGGIIDLTTWRRRGLDGQAATSAKDLLLDAHVAGKTRHVVISFSSAQVAR